MIQQDTHAHPLALVSVASLEDTTLLTQWEAHLRPLEQAGFISVWSALHLAPGTDRVQELQRQIDHADIVMVLLSADFFTASECLAMRDRALERAHEGTTQIIPLLLRSVAWQESPLGTLASWPPNGKPMTLWSDLDEGWHACVQELRRLLGRRVSEALRSERSVKQTNPDWERMLRRLRRSYKELLDQSLHGIAWAELGLSTRSDMVSNVTNLLFRLPQGGERLLSPGTKVLDAYDEAEGELLILGAPGAGKSTLLLELAQRLVSRALADPSHPLPIILRLSSWPVRQSFLTDWMIEQLTQTYDVPRHLCERWMKQGRLLPLLDGLDEMGEAARPACIAAINGHHQTQLTPLVVCSRQAEYEVASTRERLVLQSAVIIQPLSDEQIEAYLSATSPSFAGVRAALSQEPELRALATTPLMLSVLLLTYRGAAAPEILQQRTERERQVWTDYLVRQVAEKGNDTRYPLERTRAMLSWLAQQMHMHQQTIFYAEYLHTDWLVLDQQQTVTWLATRLPAMIIGGCVGLLVFLLVVSGSDNISPLQIGLLGGFIGDSFHQQISAGRIRATHHLSHERWVHFRNALLLGVLLTVSCGLSLSPYYSLSNCVRDGSILGLGGGLSFWIFQRPLHRMDGNPGRKTSAHPSWQRGLAAWLTKMAGPSVWQAVTVLGTGMGLSGGLSQGLRLGLSQGASQGLRLGLSVGIIVVLVHVILADSMGSLRFAERIHWTWRDLLRSQHLLISGSIAGALFLFFGLSGGLSGGLSEGLRLGLIFWLLLGLYQGMKQEHLEDQDRQRFNQGIRRSLRNGLLLGLISAIIISTISGLSVGLSEGLSRGLFYGLSEGLSSGLFYGLSVGLFLLFPGMVVMWALSGGLTILRHYVIRWLLARHHTFPFRAQTFLDDATARILLRRVGGGYSFIHRRLQDYFADTAAPTSEN